MSSPAMVVDGMVKVRGQVPSEQDLAELLSGKS
jgi:hypothetical protein